MPLNDEAANRGGLGTLPGIGWPNVMASLRCRGLHAPREHAMSLFLSLHAIAAERGDGLHPKLRALLERRAAEVFSDATLIPDETTSDGAQDANGKSGLMAQVPEG
jgi:hypothetical protein